MATTNHAAIINNRGEIIAIVIDVDGIPSGKVQYAYDCTIDALSGRRVLVNSRWGKLTRAKRYLESRAARECLASARCIDKRTCFPRFLVSE